MSFWKILPKPIMGMAPMDGVTDYAFRQILAQTAKPSVIFTEFVHVMALWHGKSYVYEGLKFDELQRPIVAQIFGSQPEYFYKAAHIICELGFDGIDINMGCPANTIVRRGGGAQLIQTPQLAQELIMQTRRGINDWVDGQTLTQLGLNKNKIQLIKQMKNGKHNQKLPIPISIKTRLGVETNTLQQWSDYLLETNPDALTVHGRTLKQLYHGQANWQAIASISQKVRAAGIVYLGNGDIKNHTDALEKAKYFQLDGILIGRAALGNPWVFSQNQTVELKQRLNTLLEHARVFCQNTNDKQFPALKKHLGWYCQGFDGAKKLRIQLMENKNYFEIEETVLSFGY
ncbi:hypothetical protein COX08_00230 [Candidatus Beckwithbacteria bacterium CG23_combo_of_CG06-09_8_20_14_all_34_8]|uniref:tRNA-dihydrouridine synthase n=1 Tax=Candidatus Beckwithbacteria bacterium CG23_combo_of_CG06-09_8_20_14_all_34_8 TaxID=1974497 RepID=A0A2H0B7D1_9BACT|nr:MAG: hypothetical protein COX08_00230 [Candidatus Beckwithbacteria bacterium CG23_combo_of_CG06-09_8_20_14_all_34_8]